MKNIKIHPIIKRHSSNDISPSFEASPESKNRSISQKNMFKASKRSLHEKNSSNEQPSASSGVSGVSGLMKKVMVKKKHTSSDQSMYSLIKKS